MKPRVSSTEITTLSAESAGPAARVETGLQYAALPWRERDGRLEILLITSRQSKRWIIPKGWPIEDLAPHASAAQEALEEAGIVGHVSPTVLGSFHYAKGLKSGRSINCKVIVFPLAVTRMRREWPEKHARELRWHSPQEAVEAVAETDLRLLIRRFVRQHHAAAQTPAGK
jgi:8-oxo-dGTP pyrophosphatase MutT (NUDIX family)